MVNRKSKEIISIIVIYITAFLFIFQSLSFKGDAALFPQILSVLILVLNTIQLIKVITGNLIKVKKKEDLDSKKLLLILVASIVYVLSLQVLGFVISSLIYLILAMYLLRVENKKAIVVISVLTIVVIYLSFGILLKVPIPKGILGL